ncbi:MAG: DinB family protein [Dehalococcoidia bacterium]
MASRVRTAEEIIAILRESPGRIAAVTEGVAAAQLHAAPEPGAWSVNDVLAHLRACHDVWGGNILRILAEDRPGWKAMNPRTWMKRTDYPEWEFQPALEAFAKQRADLLAVLEPLPPEGWERLALVTGMLGETYERSARYYADGLADHERQHVKNLERIIPAVQGKT